MQALLALADGTIYRGEGFGAATSATGEVVFNTAMTGYQEITTDPSYARQLVTLTYPHIGNTGCNAVDAEAARPMAAGLIIRELSPVTSNWRSETNLSDYLQQAGLPGIAGIDTRHLTRLIRDQGAQAGCLVTGDEVNEDTAIEKARAFPGLKGMDLAKEVSCKDPFEWRKGSLDLDENSVAVLDSDQAEFHVVAYDFGCKRNILRLLVDRGCRVTVVPAQTSADEVMAMQPDGVFLSNGPGDPEPCDYAIAATREFIQNEVPLFGICLGHQLLGLAVGGQSTKMKFGHHGANHPVQDLETGKVMISSQNHGFAIDEDSLPDTVATTHRSLFDGTLQGIRIKGKPAFSFQGHPEASPGPHDLRPLFDQFTHLMRDKQAVA